MLSRANVQRDRGPGLTSASGHERRFAMSAKYRDTVGNADTGYKSGSR
jgi:hypothetical protein